MATTCTSCSPTLLPPNSSLTWTTNLTCGKLTYTFVSIKMAVTDPGEGYAVWNSAEAFSEPIAADSVPSLRGGRLAKRPNCCCKPSEGPRRKPGPEMEKSTSAIRDTVMMMCVDDCKGGWPKSDTTTVRFTAVRESTEADVEIKPPSGEIANLGSASANLNLTSRLAPRSASDACTCNTWKPGATRNEMVAAYGAPTNIGALSLTSNTVTFKVALESN